MHQFCTYFDHRYLPRGLALYASLKKHSVPFRLTVLSLSDPCSRALSTLNLPEVSVVDLTELEESDSRLQQTRQNRSLIEYYFTLTPSWMLYLFQKFADVDSFTYLDADLYFFSDPAPLFEETANASIGIIGHRFPPQFKEFERFGVFNVGWLFFRRDSNADECLKWWRERCIEWCYDRAEDGRFADQKYLDDWPSRFRNVHVLTHPGAGIAPWNVQAADVHQRDGRFLIGNDPLVFYHFHAVQILNNYLYVTGLAPYGSRANGDLKELYAIYFSELKKWRRHFEMTADRIRYETAGNPLRSILEGPKFLNAPGFSIEFNPTPFMGAARYFKHLLTGKGRAEK